MNAKLSCLLAALSVASFANAAEKKAVEPHPVTATFYIANVECDKCIASITESVQRIPSVTKIEGLTPTSGYANISFDSHKDSYHVVAQAIASAKPAHGTAYAPSIKLSIPDYAKGGHAAKVDAVFAAVKDQVAVEAVDKSKGVFVARFLPLQAKGQLKGLQGFNLGKFYHPLHDEAPKGLGLAFSTVREGAPKPVAKKK